MKARDSLIMSKKIITISRQYGSGGRLIAQRLSEKLGVPVIPVAQDGYELLDAMCGLATAPPDFKPNLPEDEYYRYNPGTR